MVKTPIDRICLENDILCSACQRKVDSGEISEMDVKVSRVLNRLEKRFKSLKDATFIKSYETTKRIIILTGKGDARKVVGKGGSVVKELSKKFQKGIQVFEVKDSLEDYVKELVPPDMIIGVNRVFTKDGSYYKVILRGKDRKRMKVSRGELEEVLGKLSGEGVKVVFE
ncbi:MAG: hypothetical protein DRP11_01790 [Candidatus Aenigmatarchaeota archaeon]|nr:MAG: hypothetical protein DRP11_01790 [Candidatus Aenigmarchaeota archaeon]